MLVEGIIELLTSAQGFFDDKTANATSSSEYQEVHRV